VFTDVALFEFGIARDAFDGELCPNSGIMSVGRVIDELRERVDSCREG